jgi:hypothetical protein
MSDERSSEIIDLDSRRRERIERVRLLNTSEPFVPLQVGGGGGTFDGMEPRVARLEADVEHIKTDIGDIKSDIRSLNVLMTEARTNIATLTERVSHLPTKEFIVKSVMTSLAVITALVVFQSGIQRLFGILPPH